MVIDAITKNGTLPDGVNHLVVVTNKTKKTKRYKNAISIGMNCGEARCRSFYTQYNTIILYKDAIKYSIPFIRSFFGAVLN